MEPPALNTNMPTSSVSGFAAPRRVRSRTTSFSSDRPSTIGQSLMSPPLSVAPEAAFIAASAASQIVTNDHESHVEAWYDELGVEPSGDTALVSPGALQLANNFIDQLLFNIIGTAKSTSLSALRPAVSEVLKPKLAKDAINQADEELREYLGGGEVEDLVHSPSTQFPSDWDLELVWKRTRLRCMVYSSLGDMEEEDEDFYMEQEYLDGEASDPISGVVSPAVAIFLTSILEFLGEQVLVIAGQAAFGRLRTKYEKELREGTRTVGDVSDRIVVEELDMERVALDRTLGRLWRAWKKRIRSPVEPDYPRPFSPSSPSNYGSQSRNESKDFLLARPPYKESVSTSEEGSDVQILEEGNNQKTSEDDPARLPLPDSDVEAIYSDEEESDEEDDLPQRPRSFMVNTSNALISTPKLITVKRAQSLPPRKRPRYASPMGLNVLESTSGDTQSSATAEERKATEDVEDISEHERAAFAEAMAGFPVDMGFMGPNDFANTGASPQAAAIEGSPKADGLLAKITNSTAAIGMAAVAGLAAVATGNAPQTEVSEDEISDFEEEPEIMTSARVSIGGSIGGRSSPEISEPGRPRSIVHVRSSSTHSLRVIEVQGPRSPGIRSGVVTFETQDSLRSPVTRSTNISRESSISRTPPIVEEHDQEVSPLSVPDTDPVTSFPKARDTGIMMATPVRSYSPPRSRPPPISVQYPAPQTASIQHERSGNREFRLDVPQRSGASARQPSMPPVPEKSTSRPNFGQSSTVRRGSSESPKSSRPAQQDSPSPAASYKHKAVRTSEESASNRPVDVAKNFEELIHSNETLQYTLTPENMRDMDPAAPQRSGSPKISHKFQRSEESRQLERSRSSSLRRSISVNKATGLNSHPPTDFPINGRHAGATPKSPISMPPKGRTGATHQPRDARIPGDSVQDFAEFIRATGPSVDSNARLDRANPTNVTIGRNITAPTPAQSFTGIDNRRPGAGARTRLQARDATVNATNESSELIDFIRRGPPNTSSTSPRIPRHVAPFRTTMDSDMMQMTGATGGKAIDAVIPEVRSSHSTHFTESSAPSSMNSSSALLNKAPMYSGNQFDDDDMMPKRTQRRVRDPYAIDLSDEDDDLNIHTPKPKPKEESLIDFLNSYQPPPEPTPQPIIVPKKKSSTPNLIARLRSGGHSNVGFSANGMRKGSTSSESRNVVSRPATGKGTTLIGSRGVPEHPSQNYVPTTRVTTGRVPMKKFEPRDPVSTSTRTTSDLAKFLRDSEPPPSAIAALPSPTEDRNSNGLSRMFGGRKRSAAY